MTSKITRRTALKGLAGVIGAFGIPGVSIAESSNITEGTSNSSERIEQIYDGKIKLIRLFYQIDGDTPRPRNSPYFFIGLYPEGANYQIDYFPNRGSGPHFTLSEKGCPDFEYLRKKTMENGNFIEIDPAYLETIIGNVRKTERAHKRLDDYLDRLRRRNDDILKKISEEVLGSGGISSFSR